MDVLQALRHIALSILAGRDCVLINVKIRDGRLILPDDKPYMVVGVPGDDIIDDGKRLPPPRKRRRHKKRA
ncbi:MAG: hypothetical protein QNI84_14040 [Henriciella sp.]|nr:hypothetical protein [Henriciella sp.]